MHLSFEDVYFQPDNLLNDNHYFEVNKQKRLLRHYPLKKTWTHQKKTPPKETPYRPPTSASFS